MSNIINSKEGNSDSSTKKNQVKRRKKRGFKNSCLQCGENYFGRVDKKFCDYHCRNKYYYVHGHTLKDIQADHSGINPFKDTKKKKPSAKNLSLSKASSREIFIIARAKNEQSANSVIKVLQALFPEVKYSKVNN